MQWWHWRRAQEALAAWIRSLIGPDRIYTLRYGPGEQSFVNLERQEIVIDPQVVDRLEGAEENFRAVGLTFEALFTWRDFS